MAATTQGSRRRTAISISLILLWILFSALVVTGGAARADALGQAVIRPVAALVLAVLILGRIDLKFADHRRSVILMVVVIAVPVIQLIPLPPSLWIALPGRETFAGIASLAGADQPWRPIAIVPDAAMNALASLLAPAAALTLAMSLSSRERASLPGLVFALACVSALWALIQLSGAAVDNPLINETPRIASGIMANPNHQALLLAIGMVAGTAWANSASSGQTLRLAIAAGGAIWFLLMILAAGSRTGLAIGCIALVAAAIIARPVAMPLFGRLSRPARSAAVGVGFAIPILLVALSFWAGRAVSLDRLLALSTGDDMRSRSLSTVWEMIGAYMPFGSGLGGFDPLFRMHEPDTLLKPTYFNHAHNDYLEVAMATGLAGIVLMAVALAWFGQMSVAAWRLDTKRSDTMAARFGAITLALILIASAVDYPLRTPIIMVVAAIALVLVDRATKPARP